MTANQVAYWKLQEEKRANLVKEGETERSNKAKEQETLRSNQAKEALTAELNKAQMERMKTQSGVDIANAVTGGIKNVGQGVSSVAGMFL